MNNNGLYKYILSTIFIMVLLVAVCTVSVYARTGDNTAGETDIEISTEEITEAEDATETTTETATEFPTEATTEMIIEVTTEVMTEITTEDETGGSGLPWEPSTEVTTHITTEGTTQTTTEKATQPTTQTTTEPSTETTTKAPVRSSGGGGSSKSCRVTFQSGEMGKIGSSVSVSVIINKGTVPKIVPAVTPKAGMVFVGWTKNGVTITDPKKVPLYSNTVYTAVYKEKSGLDKLLNLGGILDKLGL